MGQAAIGAGQATRVIVFSDALLHLHPTVEHQCRVDTPLCSRPRCPSVATIPALARAPDALRRDRFRVF